jgi:hypothetical protein
MLRFLYRLFRRKERTTTLLLPNGEKVSSVKVLKYRKGMVPDRLTLRLGKLAVPPLAVTARRVRPAATRQKNRASLQRQFSA